MDKKKKTWIILVIALVVLLGGAYALYAALSPPACPQRADRYRESAADVGGIRFARDGLPRGRRHFAGSLHGRERRGRH